MANQALRATLGVMLAALSVSAWASPEVCVTDDADRHVCLDKPAQRIVSLSPGATELLFDAGAGEQVVATVSHSDHPEAAQEIPRVGTYDRLDMEAILARKPDLIIGWNSGNPAKQLDKLSQMATPLYRSEPRRFQDIGNTLKRFGRLADSEEQARRKANRFANRITQLRDTYADRNPVTVFYEVWPNPLMSVNNEHLIGQAIQLCGGRNIFADLDALTPRISQEAVIERNPEAIVAGGMGEADRSWLEPWRDYQQLDAVKNQKLYFVPPAQIQRPTPRMADGTRLLCQKLDKAREQN